MARTAAFAFLIVIAHFGCGRKDRVEPPPSAEPAPPAAALDGAKPIDECETAAYDYLEDGEVGFHCFQSGGGRHEAITVVREPSGTYLVNWSDGFLAIASLNNVCGKGMECEVAADQRLASCRRGEHSTGNLERLEMVAEGEARHVSLWATGKDVYHPTPFFSTCRPESAVLP